MKVKFKSNIRLANKTGTGFLAIPKEKSISFDLHENVEVILNSRITFFSQIIRWGRFGIYIPKEISKEFIGTKVSVNITKIDAVYAKVGSDGRIYIPVDVVEKLGINDREIIRLEVNLENGCFERYSEIIFRKRGHKLERMCMLGANLAGKRISFKVIKCGHNFKTAVDCLDLSEFLKNARFAQTSNGNLIIFKRKMPITINPKINLHDLALYLGAYYSDGTKKGNNWAISASTFEQAKFYIKMHTSLIKNAKMEYVISYTDIKNQDENVVIKNLNTVWNENVGQYPYKIKIRKPLGTHFCKCTKYGTLTIRQGRIALLDFYKYLVERLLSEIKSTGDISLAVDFICGILEGDGSAGHKERGHILIASNEKEFKPIADVLDTIGMRHKVIKESPNRYAIRIGTLEILRNFELLKDKIFALYPKRRRTYFERLRTVGAVQFLLGQGISNGRIKAWLRDNGFVDDNYKLTAKGERLSNNLKTCIEDAQKLTI